MSQGCAPPGRALAALLATLALAHAAAASSGERVKGAYCPLPRKGEVPRCLAPAQANYEAFFDELDAGNASGAGIDQVEAEVARGSAGGNAYLALSSLSYGYFRLAERAATTPGEDPEIVARLERWNALLARAYDTSGDDPHYRDAVRLAAEDLNDRVDFPLTCRDARGEAVDCNSTESVLRGINATSERVGVRGALERVFRRLFGSDAS
jgi:hypothetical protein